MVPQGGGKMSKKCPHDLWMASRPEIQMAAMAAFGSVQDAINAVVGILQNSIPVARIEFLDKLSMKICNLYNKTDYEEIPTLFMEFHGSEKRHRSQTMLPTVCTLREIYLQSSDMNYSI